MSPNYISVYNTTSQVVAVEGDIGFSATGASSGGLTHTPGTTNVVVGTAATYLISFTVSAVEPNQFTVFINGAPVAGSTFGSGTGTQQNHGEVVVALAAGDVITLRNHTSASAVTLQTVAGGTETNVNASLFIRAIG